MSTTIHLPPPPPVPTTPIAHYYISNLGLGYAIAIALGFLVLFSTILLASYICLHHRYTYPNPNTIVTGSNNNGIILPAIIIVDNNSNGNSNDSNGINDNVSIVVGLDESVINSYPMFPFKKGNANVTDSVCVICLCEYREMEMMRMLPDCKHCFHLSCVDAWLKMNATCPVCRNSPLPTPLSTPLAEVVPLSQYSDDRHRR